MSLTTPDDFNTMLTFPRSAAGWLALARRLDDGEWHPQFELGEQMAAETDLQPQTARSILRHAHRAGYLQKRVGAKKRRYYRVTDEGRRQRPELRVR